MEIDENILLPAERLSYKVMSNFAKRGYTRYKVGKFEEYDLYAKNRSFLLANEVLSFTDLNGKLMALRPDITLSIVKNVVLEENKTEKLFYSENVYRPNESMKGFQESSQTGLECIGCVGAQEEKEVIELACESLQTISCESVLSIANVELLKGILKKLPASIEKDVLTYMQLRNLEGLAKLCQSVQANADVQEKIEELASLYGSLEETLPRLASIVQFFENEELTQTYKNFENLCKTLDTKETKFVIDFSIISDLDYYSGIVFHGFVPNSKSNVLSGGRYDNLLTKMGKQGAAIGFALYLEKLNDVFSGALNDEATEDAGSKENEEATLQACVKNAEKPQKPQKVLRVALPKGRLGKSAYEKFEIAGFGGANIEEESRKLVFESKSTCPIKLVYFWVKPTDVAKYVEQGSADIGIVGRDILLEYKQDVLQLANLDIGKCALYMAAPENFSYDHKQTLRVATSYPRITQAYYLSKSQDVDIIKLHGSVEIAPLLELADCIVDIVETGKTLKENNLFPKEKIEDISAWFVANKTSFNFKYEDIQELLRCVKSDANAKSEAK